MRDATHLEEYESSKNLSEVDLQLEVRPEALFLILPARRRNGEGTGSQRRSLRVKSGEARQPQPWFSPFQIGRESFEVMLPNGVRNENLVTSIVMQEFEIEINHDDRMPL